MTVRTRDLKISDQETCTHTLLCSSITTDFIQAYVRISVWVSMHKTSFPIDSENSERDRENQGLLVIHLYVYAHTVHTFNVPNFTESMICCRDVSQFG